MLRAAGRLPLLLWWLCLCVRVARDGAQAKPNLENLVIRMPFNIEVAVDTEVANEEYRHDDLERNHLYNIARRAVWTPAQAGYLEQTKVSVIGGAHKYPRRLAQGNSSAPCAWDCYRRATMLEPLVSWVLDKGVEGDFCEAGVLYGGISIYMAAMLRARGELGTHKRRMWVADSFAGLPPASYSEGFEQGVGKGLGITSGELNGMLGKYRNSKLTGTRDVVEDNFRKHLLPFQPAGAPPAPTAPLDGVRFVKGFFNESLPGPIKAEGRKLALLRVDSDIFSSIYETLERLYPLLSVGGYVVFDDWKIKQARAAAVVYRSRYGIKSKIFGSDLSHAPPFWSIDRMAFWRKEAGEGEGKFSSANATLDEQLSASVALAVGLRSGKWNMRRGICFTGGTLASKSRQASEATASAEECYNACRSDTACKQFTFKVSPARCLLKTASAMPVREGGGSGRGSRKVGGGHRANHQCVSGIVDRSV